MTPEPPSDFAHAPHELVVLGTCAHAHPSVGFCMRSYHLCAAAHAGGEHTHLWGCLHLCTRIQACVYFSPRDYSVRAFPSACPPVGLCAPVHTGAAALVRLPVKRTYSMSWQTLSVKGQKESNFSFVGHTVSVTTIQPCHCGTKAAKDKVSD